MVTTTHHHSTATTSDNHGALIADAAQAYFKVFLVEQAIRQMAKTHPEFSADDVDEAVPGLPQLGNAAGGLYMRLHRAGVLRRCGYRPSNKPSRAGGVVAIWTAGDQA